MARPPSQPLAEQAKQDVGGVKTIHSVLQPPELSLSRTFSSSQQKRGTQVMIPTSPFLQPPVTSNPHSVFMNLPILGISYEASCNIYLLGWLISFSIMLLRLTHIVPCITIPSLFMAE